MFQKPAFGLVLELKESEMEAIIRNAVDESLSLLGTPGKELMYFHLENSFDLKKQEIPVRLEKFADAIHIVFGSGASLLEDIIVRKLRQSQNPDFSKAKDLESIVIGAKHCLKEKHELGK